jgi:hypothetical protein
MKAQAKEKSIRLLVVSACLFTSFEIITPRVAQAQLLQGTIDGNVTDASHAAVAGARAAVSVKR